MTYIILLFGVLILIGGGTLLIKSDYIFSLITKYTDSLNLHITAVVVRVILGVALIIGATDSKYPVALLILGWLTVIAALILAVIGRERFKSLINWSVKTKISFQRTIGILAILFGGFLIYAVL